MFLVNFTLLLFDNEVCLPFNKRNEVNLKSNQSPTVKNQNKKSKTPKKTEVMLHFANTSKRTPRSTKNGKTARNDRKIILKDYGI